MPSDRHEVVAAAAGRGLGVGERPRTVRHTDVQTAEALGTLVAQRSETDLGVPAKRSSERPRRRVPGTSVSDRQASRTHPPDAKRSRRTGCRRKSGSPANRTSPRPARASASRRRRPTPTASERDRGPRPTRQTRRSRLPAIAPSQGGRERGGSQSISPTPRHPGRDPDPRRASSRSPPGVRRPPLAQRHRHARRKTAPVPLTPDSHSQSSRILLSGTHRYGTSRTRLRIAAYLRYTSPPASLLSEQDSQCPTTPR